MDYSDSELQGQIVLASLVVLIGAAFLLRAVIFLRHESTGIRPLYPDSWTDDQRRTLEQIRLVIGLLLVPLWAAYLSVTPLTPRNWRFELVLLMLMLLVSYAWTLLRQFETAGRISSILLADDRFSRALLRDSILSNRLDVDRSFSPSINSHNPSGRLRGA